MPIFTTDFVRLIASEIDSVRNSSILQPIIFGGVGGPDGGNGGPIAGIIGQLPQKKVAFDTTESTNNTILGSGNSLLINLNRIRGGAAMGNSFIQQRHIASGVGTLTLQDATHVLDHVVKIKLSGATFTQDSPPPSGVVTINLTPSLTLQEVDAVPTVANVSKIIVTNGTLTDNFDGSVNLSTGGGTLGNATAQYKYLIASGTPFPYVESLGYLNIAATKTLTVNDSMVSAGQNFANVFTQTQTVPVGTVGSPSIIFSTNGVGLFSSSSNHLDVVSSGKDIAFFLYRLDNGNDNAYFSLGTGQAITDAVNYTFASTISFPGGNQTGDSGYTACNIGQTTITALDTVTKSKRQAVIEFDFLQLQQSGGAVVYNDVMHSQFRLAIVKTGVTVAASKGISFVWPAASDITGTITGMMAIEIPSLNLNAVGGTNYYGMMFRGTPVGGSIVGDTDIALTINALGTGAVKLQMAGSTKLATTATGVDVTGTIKISSGILAGGTAGGDSLYEFGSGNIVLDNQYSLKIYNAARTSFSLYGLSSANNVSFTTPTDYGSMQFSVVNSSGAIQFYTNSTVQSFLIATNGDVSVPSANFFVDTNLLFVKKSTGVGIGTTDPQATKLQINTASAALGTAIRLLNANNTTSAGPLILFSADTTVGVNHLAKGGIAFVRTGGYGVGDFHILQNSAAGYTDADSLTYSVVTVKSNGNVGIGTTLVDTAHTTYDKLNVQTGGLLFTGQSASAFERALLQITPSFVVNTDASRTAQAIFNVYSSAGAKNVMTLVSNGQTIFGGTSVSPITVPGAFIVADGTGGGFGMMAYQNSVATNVPVLAGYAAAGTLGSPTASQSGDVLMRVSGRGYGTTQFATASRARMDYLAAEVWSDTVQGTRIEFYTTPTGGTATTLALTIRQDQSFVPVGLLDISGASAGQILFPTAQNASANANTLDDYEEGTYTPVFVSTGASFTYTTQLGYYTKIGNAVHAIIHLNGTATGTVTNALTFSLPFSSNTLSGGGALPSGSIGYTDFSVMPAVLSSGGANAEIYRQGTTSIVSPTSAGMITGVSRIIICSITYFV